MAYENVRLEDGKEKVVMIDGYEKIAKRITIDLETGNFMFQYYVDQDSPSHVRFVIVIREIVVNVWFYKHVKDDDHRTMIWKLERISRCGDVKNEELFEEITKAFGAYGCHGMTKIEQKRTKKRFKVDNPNGFGIVDLGRYCDDK